MRVTLSLAMVKSLPPVPVFFGAREPGVQFSSTNLLYFHLGDFELDVVVYILTWHFCYCIISCS